MRRHAPKRRHKIKRKRKAQKRSRIGETGPVWIPDSRWRTADHAEYAETETAEEQAGVNHEKQTENRKTGGESPQRGTKGHKKKSCL
jgi:hypothetical protein